MLDSCVTLQLDAYVLTFFFPPILNCVYISEDRYCFLFLFLGGFHS